MSAAVGAGILALLAVLWLSRVAYHLVSSAAGGDSYDHRIFIREIRESGYRIPGEPELFATPGSHQYPYLLQWVLAVLPVRFEATERSTSAVSDLVLAGPRPLARTPGLPRPRRRAPRRGRGVRHTAVRPTRPLPLARTEQPQARDGADVGLARRRRPLRPDGDARGDGSRGRRGASGAGTGAGGAIAGRRDASSAGAGALPDWSAPVRSWPHGGRREPLRLWATG